MPTILRIGALRFFFYSNENGEPAHIHVESGDDTAKYWLQPVSLARFQGFRGHELREIQALVVVHQQTFLDAWHEFFGR